ncbi:MAG: hypothetical protein COW71_12240 [Ignavibacteriales bacterium CG18_big_fil_WC_8_21_14_2_50_31_20]|nr:MAG: hypothetical protein COW71_12240 [Ignavibacteriales bacterium CG18_big_fil_WC_8_21_14_2_50_31_20]
MHKFLIILFCVISQNLFAQTSVPPSLGDGSPGNPYQIANLNNLFWITQNSNQWDKNYIQTAEIDASTSSTWDGGAGYSPIGDDVTKFIGVYDGQNYKILNLYVSRNTKDYVGLFGYTVGANISNVKLESVNILGSTYVGGLIGRQETYTSYVTNSYSNGSVHGVNYVGGLIGEQNTGNVTDCNTAGTVSGESYVGGLVGQQYQSAVTNCFSTSSVTSTVEFAGGLTAYHYVATTENSYSTGTVNGVSHVGGLIGMENGSSATITNCYSVGDVIATGAAVGGLIGEQGNSANVSKCYSSGSVTGTSYVGGLIGTIMNTGSATDCFWDLTTSGQSSSQGGTGKLTTDMKNQTTFLNAGWSSAVWNIGDGINNGYPYLDWQNPDGTPLPAELTGFNAFISEVGIILNWSTATEVNNYGFEVERKLLGDNFEWETLGFVEGHGNSNSHKEYTFIDGDNLSGVVQYRLKQIDIDGRFEYSGIVDVEINTVKKFELSQNFPNPFNPSTVIKYSIPKESKVKVSIYTVLGEEIFQLVNTQQNEGYYNVTWNAQNLSSGIYFVRIVANSIDGRNNFVSIKKMILIK